MLKILNSDDSIPGVLEAGIGRDPSLKSFSISSFKTDNPESLIFAQTHFFKQSPLKKLEIVCCDFGVENLKIMLNQIAESQTLKDVNLRYLQGFNEAIDEFCNMIKTNKSIEKLDISLNSTLIRDEFCFNKIIEALKHNYTITSLEHTSGAIRESLEISGKISADIMKISNRNQILKRNFGYLEDDNYNTLCNYLFFEEDQDKIDTILQDPKMNYTVFRGKITSINEYLPKEFNVSEDKIKVITDKIKVITDKIKAMKERAESKAQPTSSPEITETQTNLNAKPVIPTSSPEITETQTAQRARLI